MITGKAKDDRETFEFAIEPFVSGGFLLTIRFRGDGRSNTTGAGVWPSVEKAKSVAEESPAKLLHGTTVVWDGDRSAQG
jgi:hypothetical protein